MFRSKNWSRRSRLFLGDDLFPWKLEAGNESAISEYAFVYGLGRVTTGGRDNLALRSYLRRDTRSHQAGFSLAVSADYDRSRGMGLCACVGRAGVTIGGGAILGARTVAMKNMNPWTIVVRNPARESKRREITQ